MSTEYFMPKKLSPDWAPWEYQVATFNEVGKCQGWANQSNIEDHDKSIQAHIAWGYKEISYEDQQKLYKENH